jgi:hypothetical protein
VHLRREILSACLSVSAEYHQGAENRCLDTCRFENSCLRDCLPVCLSCHCAFLCFCLSVSLCLCLKIFSLSIGGPTESLVRDCVPTPFERTSIFLSIVTRLRVHATWFDASSSGSLRPFGPTFGGVPLQDRKFSSCSPKKSRLQLHKHPEAGKDQS